jgi:hypothetical protein
MAGVLDDAEITRILLIVKVVMLLVLSVTALVRVGNGRHSPGSTPGNEGPLSPPS